MGRNSKQRRDAKQRKRQQRAGGRPHQGRSGDPFGAPPDADSAAAYGLAELQVFGAVRRLGRRRLDSEELQRTAEALLRRLHPIPVHVPAAILGGLLERLTDQVVDGGWSPSDLAELVDRNADPADRPTLAALLRDHARRRRVDTPHWRAAADAVAPDEPLRLGTTAGFASGLRLAALLSRTPLMDTAEHAGRATGSPRAEHPKLAQVRALLAKAESTPFEEEAEALSAKAQEMITRYALEHLLGQRDGREPSAGLTARRIWLDPPYVAAKNLLVHEVASANRCRSASCDHLGFALVVGADADLEAVDLLVTSLLVQADIALLVHGRRVDESGTPRTRSFRRAFLLAYASRIGERLRAASADAVAADDDARLPVLLRDHETRVSEAFDVMVPHTVAKGTTISNGAGWVAGSAAADLASLDIFDELTEQAG